MYPTFLSIPCELHLLIAEHLTAFRDKASLVRTSRGLYHLNNHLYRSAVLSGPELNGPPRRTDKLDAQPCILADLISRGRRGLPGLSLLLEHGLDIHIKLGAGSSTLLVRAMETERYAAVRFLLERGANPNVASGVERGGLTPLRMAVREGNCELARLLLAHGAEADMPDAAGKKPLYDAVVNGRVDLLRLLVDHGADMDASVTAEEMDMPLSLACASYQGKVMTWLINNGAETSRLNAEEMAYLKRYIP